MRSDMVRLRTCVIERLRKQLLLGRVDFYEKVGIHFLTGAKLMRGEPVNLRTAGRIASALGVQVQDLIKAWGDDVRERRNDLGLLGKSSRRTAERAGAVAGVME